jgi:hypothetical protein
MSGVRQTPEGSLEPCEAQGCDQCNFEKKKMCRGCEKGFVGSPDEGDANFVACQPCKQAKTCAICDGDLETCLHCKLGYTLASEGVCMESVNHHKCKSQEYDSMTGVCQDCLYDLTDVKTRNNYSWSTTLGTCIHSCPPQCQTCEDEDLCETCKPGFRWDQNLSDCIPCGVKDCLNCFEHPYTCLQCFDGYYFSFSTRKCEKCHQSCATCSGPKPRDCQKCFLDQFLQKIRYERENLVTERRKQEILRKHKDFQHHDMLNSGIFHYKFDRYCLAKCLDPEKVRRKGSPNYKLTDPDLKESVWVEQLTDVAKGSAECVELAMSHPDDRTVKLGDVKADWDYASQGDNEKKKLAEARVVWGNEIGEVPGEESGRDFFEDGSGDL